MFETLKSKLFGEKAGNSETRHRPWWMPQDFDWRPLGGRLAVMHLPPYKPPYRRHSRYKAWVCAGPNHILHLVFMLEVDLDERNVDLEVYQ